MSKDESMFLLNQAPFRRRGDSLLVESQAVNGLERWADNFSKVVVAAPLIPDHEVSASDSTVWRDVSDWEYRDRVELVPLPYAYRVSEFLAAYRPTRRLMADAIARCHFLQFAIGGLVGDWGVVGALEARSQGRRYAIHTDWVSHRVSVVESRKVSFKRHVKAQAVAPLMKVCHESIIRRCEVSLLHGADCFSYYKGISKNPYLIHNVHLKPSDCITGAEVEGKVAAMAARPALRICYAGRMAPMKAPLEWVRALARARELGVELEATWLGNGPLLDEARGLVRELGMEDCVRMPGHVADRASVLRTIRESDLMLFCHVTPESPRCLLESLICGTPLVGYDSAYPRDLIGESGGGLLTGVHDWEGLAEMLRTLSEDRKRLGDLIREAGANGARFNDAAVFRERSEHIKRHLA